MKRTFRVLLVALGAMWAGCDDDHHHHHDGFDIGQPEGGISAARFDSLNDYLSHPTVKLILDNMPRHRGSSPRDVSGTYDFAGEVIASNFPYEEPLGEFVSASFCLGRSTGGILDVVVSDPLAQDVGAVSFIEGEADVFTVYTAFVLIDGGCEFHLVNVYSGRLRSDRKLVELFIGQGVVALVGDCGSFLVGDVEVSLGEADQVPRRPDPGLAPVDPSKVLVKVQNSLLNPLEVFVNLDIDPDPLVIEVPAKGPDLGDPPGEAAFEVEPGYTLTTASIQPEVLDGDGSVFAVIGERVVAFFPPDCTGAGSAVLYSVNNDIGGDLFFAPRPVNCTSEDIFAVVNIGVEIPEFSELGTDGFDCFCEIVPAPACAVGNEVDLGYYSYSRPGIIEATDTNVNFFRVADESLIFFQDGPFPLEADTGAFLFDVPEPPP